MKFTPIIFASAVAAANYYAEPAATTTSSSAAAYGGGYGEAWPKASSSSTPAGAVWPKPSSSSVSKKWMTTTSYSTECYTVTSSGTTKVWTSVKAYPTVCEDDEWSGSWGTKSTAASATPTYCPAVTETCTVTVTATAGSGYTAKPVASYSAGAEAGAWPNNYAKPSGSASYTMPAAQFTGAASAQKAGAFVAGVGAFAAMLL